MERDKGFNFKLLVPPRVNTGQVSAVRPQEITKNCDDFMNALQQGYSKCFDKEQNRTQHLPNTGLVAPTKPNRQDPTKMKVVSPMEKDETNFNPGQLYNKLFDEVEKIKCWKVKLDSDTVQMERQLQENKRTIETQRKAIQELQFGNESLSIKLEEQISENEDLRNKNGATRNLCNLLKETFEGSAEKMHLLESEREETHNLFMENTANIQKLIAAFESLHLQAEAEQQEMLKVKECLLHFEELKKKHQECNIREEEVARIQTTLKDKEDKLQKVLFDLHETEKHCKQLQEATNQQYELLRSSKTEQEALLQRLQTAEQCYKESEKTVEAITAALEQNKDDYAKIIQSKDVSLQELMDVKNQLTEKLDRIETTFEELQNSLSLKMQRLKELEDNFRAHNNELEKTKSHLDEILEQSAKKDGQIIILKDELDEKSKSFESMKSEIEITGIRVAELTDELSRKTEESRKFKSNVQHVEEKLHAETKKNKEYTVQIEQLRNDITQHSVKYEELLSNFNELQSEKMEIELQLNSGSSYVKTIQTNMKVSEEKAVKLNIEIHRLEEENQSLRDEVNSIKTKVQGKCQETDKKIDKYYEHMKKEITEKEKYIKVVETKLCSLRRKIDTKLKAQDEYQKENKMLKKQIADEIAKSSQLENVIGGLHEECHNFKSLQEDYQKLKEDFESKSTFAAELENEVQKLSLAAVEAIKNKEDAELKCQHKISDMVALMEKHKSQYDRMVEEKDAELQENKKREAEVVAHRKTLELNLSMHKTENYDLKKQLKKETTEKENQQKEITELKKELSLIKITPLSEAKNKQSHASNYEQERCSVTLKDVSSIRHVFDFSKCRKTPSYSKDNESAAVLKEKEFETESIKTSRGTAPKTMDIYTEDLKTPRNVASRLCGSSKIKSYRIRTPPAEKAARWGKSTIEIDPKSDSSDQNDYFTFADEPQSNLSSLHCRAKTFKKVQSPVTQKSPGNTLKLAAMKRMRDAGWTAVTGCDKKKKTNEKIFA